MSDLTMQQITVDGATKYAMSFPLTDENGQPILDRAGKPRFTNIVGETPEEVAVKIAQANIEVARALNRAQQHIHTLQNKKPTAARPAADLKPKPLTQEEQVQVGLDAQDPRKAAGAIQRVVESVVPVAEITAEVKRQAQTLDFETRKAIARQFFAAHPDYDTMANGSLLGKWLVDNQYEFSLDNIEIAFAALQEKLGRRTPPNNEPPAVPVNAAPDNEPQNRELPPPQPRRAPVGGISNSQATGRPQSGQSLPYTREQLLTMAVKQDPKYAELIRNPRTNAMVTAILSGAR